MKILVIGGTGTMGKPLVDLLFEDNEVHVICRRKGNEINGVHYHYGNAKDRMFMDSVLNTHYDSIIDFCLYSSSEFKDSYKQLLAATMQYVCLSTIQVCADSEGIKNEESPRFIETDPPIFKVGDDKYYWYCYEKARIEDILKNSGGKNWTIVRPSITMNENHYLWNDYIDEEWTYRIVRGRSIVVPKNILDTKTSITYGGDVAHMLLAIIGNPSTLGEIYNVTSSIYTWGELLNLYLKVFRELGFKVKIKYIENHEPLIRCSHHRCTYERTRIIDRSFDSSKVYRLMDQMHIERNFASLDEKIEEWVKKDINKIPEKITKQIDSIARLDRITNEWTPLSSFATIRLKEEYVAYRFPYLLSFIRSIMRLLRCFRRVV